MTFSPTTTVSFLLQNNTSAANTFAGWPNNVPAPAATSDEPLGVTQTVLAHRCDWWGGTSHPSIGINVTDPIYAAKTVADMKARGFHGVSELWHGSTSLENKAALALKPELEKAGMKLVICIGSSAPTLGLPPDKHPTVTVAQRTAALNLLFDYIKTNFMASPAYLKVNGRPLIQFFGITGVDWDVVRAHIQGFSVGNPLLYFRWETNYGSHPQADGYFGWTSCTEDWVTGVKKLGKGVILGANARFDNTVAGDPVRCTWGVDHPTIKLSNGGLRWMSQIALAKAHPELPILMINTWNDYQEGSAIEVGLSSNFTPVLSLANNDLVWAPLPAPFARYDLYVSNGTDALMKLGSFSGTQTTVALDSFNLPYGHWTFYLHAVGMNTVHNVLSVPLVATLGWS